MIKKIREEIEESIKLKTDKLACILFMNFIMDGDINHFRILDNIGKKEKRFEEYKREN